MRWRKQRLEPAETRIVRSLTVGEYRKLLGGVPMPSGEQIAGFSQYVPRAHSWYKGPLLLGGLRMTFFVYPGARGQRVAIGPDRRLHQLGSLEQGFHKSSQPTNDRFGHAAYDSRSDALFAIRKDGSEVGSPNGKTPVYRPGPVRFEPDRDELVALPDEVREAGGADLSGLMHPRACLPLLVGNLRGTLHSERVVWPAESGGAAAFAEILERLHALSVDPQIAERPPDGLSDGHYLTGGGDFVLYRLLTPERERQQRLITAALERVIDLVR